VDVIVAGTRFTIAAVVAVSTDKIANIAVLAVALIARHRPPLGQIGTERGQDDADNDDGRRGQQTGPTWTEFVTTCRGSHRSTEKFNDGQTGP